MSTTLQLRAASADLEDIGSFGGILLSDTTPITGIFTQMIVLEDAVLDTFTTKYTKNDDTTLAVAADWGTLYKGTKFNGVITAVTLTSGSVLLLSAKEG